MGGIDSCDNSCYFSLKIEKSPTTVTQVNSSISLDHFRVIVIVDVQVTINITDYTQCG